MIKKKIEKLIFLLLGILIIIFLSNSLLNNWNKVKEIQLSINFTILIISLLIYIINLYIRATGWYLILKSIKVSLTFSESIGIYYISQLARYIPSGVVQFLGRVYLAKKKGISEGITFVTIIYEVGFDILGSIVVSLIFILSINRNYIPYFLMLFIIVIIVTTNSKLQMIFITFINKKFNKKLENISLKKRNILLILIFYIISWFIFGYAFSLFCNSLGVHGNRAILISVFPSSWIIGFLSPFPGGIGIREGILQYFLSLIFEFPIPIIISLVSRVWLIVGELIGGVVIIFLFIKRNIKRHFKLKLND